MSKKPNIIYIHSHDSGNVFSPYGYDVPTPKIAAFSRTATLYKSAFCVSPTCSPSRAALLTGQFPHNNGMLGLANRGFQLNNYSEHLVQILKSSGYKTVLCGIQHEYGRYLEHQKGAEIIGYCENITTSHEQFKEEELFLWDNQNVEAFEKWLTKYDESKPFFCSIGFFCTHREYSNYEYDSNFILPGYLDDNEIVRMDYSGHLNSLKHLDENVGKIITQLKNANFYEETMIIFTSDHGIAFPNCKCTLREAGTAVALIIKYPGQIQGKRITEQISHIELLSLILDNCNIPLPDKVGTTMNIIRNNKEKYVFSEINCHTSYEPCRSVRGSRYKYIKYYDQEHEKINISNIDNSMSKEDFILSRLGMDKEMEQFYDLENDPFEKVNLINHEEYIMVIEEYQNILKKWQEDTNDYLLKGKLEFSSMWKINKSICVDPKSKKEYDFL